MELTALRYAYLLMRARLAAARRDQRGVVSLETVLWTAGLAALAIATLVVVVQKVTTARDNIPTGP